jgi:hypothetical protein
MGREDPVGMRGCGVPWHTPPERKPHPTWASVRRSRLNLAANPSSRHMDSTGDASGTGGRLSRRRRQEVREKEKKGAGHEEAEERRRVGRRILNRNSSRRIFQPGIVGQDGRPLNTRKR